MYQNRHTYVYAHTHTHPSSLCPTHNSDSLILLSDQCLCHPVVLSGAPGGAMEPLQPSSGLTLADTGWVMLASCSPGGQRRQGTGLGPEQRAWRKVTARAGVINRTRSRVSTVPLSISVATSCPNCICSSHHASSAHGCEGKKNKKKRTSKWGCISSDTQA